MQEGGRGSDEELPAAGFNARVKGVEGLQGAVSWVSDITVKTGVHVAR